MGLVDDMARRIGNMLFRGVIKRVDDTNPMQALQVSGRAGELRDGLHHLLPYPLSTVVPADGQAETLVMTVDRGHQVALPAGVRAARVRGLAAGDWALGSVHDDPHAGPRGAWHRLHFFLDGDDRTAVLAADVFEVRCGSTLLRVDGDGVTISGAVTITGAVASTGGVTVAGPLHASGDITSGGQILDTAGNTANHSHG